MKLPNNQNLTLYGPTRINGLLSTGGSIIFMGLDAQLSVTMADVSYAKVILSEQDLKRIVKESVLSDEVFVGAGVGAIDLDTEYAASCYQARSSFETETIGRDANDNKVVRAYLVYSGFWSACATWTIPVHAVIHTLILAGGVAFVIWTYCISRSRQ